MDALSLIIGQQNTSSWSLRAWLALRMTGRPFELIKIDFKTAEGRRQLNEMTPAGLVPALRDGALMVWDSLAICEYLADRYPAAPLWPADPAARAVARAVSAEMHSGFAALRQEMPMDYCGRHPAAASPAVQTCIDRITAIWQDTRRQFGGDGPLLFGRFTIADAMYAPVASRFRTYEVPLDPVSAAYRDAVLALPACQEWGAAAAREIAAKAAG